MVQQLRHLFILYFSIIEFTKMKKEKNLETSLVLSTACVIFGLIWNIEWLFYVAIGFGVIGLFVDTVAGWVNWAWYKLADVLGFVMSKVLLSSVFYIFLFPVAMLYRLFSDDPLQLKRKKDTYWEERNHEYKGKDLENVW